MRFGTLVVIGFLIISGLVLPRYVCAKSPQQAPPVEEKSPYAKAKAAYEELMNCRDFEEMKGMVQLWKKDLGEAALDHLVGMFLLEKIGSQESASLDLYKNMAVEWRVGAGKMPEPPADGVILKQDVFVVGGRAAWALEQLSGFEIPAVTEKSTGAEITNSLLQARRKVTRAHWEKKKQMDGTLQGLDKDARLKKAQSKEATARSLRTLSYDEDVDVRKAVASNKNTPIDALFIMLSTDENQEVRNLAQKNSQHARTAVEISE